MLHFSLADEIEIVAVIALVFVGGPALLVALGILAFPRGRRSRVGRRVAFSLLGLAGVLLLAGSPFLVAIAGVEIDDLMAPARLAARTRHPQQPTTYDGILFPAGSTVQLYDEEGGEVQLGSVPSETMILGLPLIGSFWLGHSGEDRVRTVGEGTLARPAVIHGLPCGPGPVASAPDETTCLLEHNFPYRGFRLAGGQRIKVYRSPLSDPPAIEYGVLGSAQTLFDITWPPGSILTNTGGSTAEQLRHDHGVDNQSITVCLPRGADAGTPWGALHGPASYSVNGEQILMSNFCVADPDIDEPKGYAAVGPTRFERGEREDAQAAWTWSDPLPR